MVDEHVSRDHGSRLSAHALSSDTQLPYDNLIPCPRSGRHISYSLYDERVVSLLDEAVYHAEHLCLGEPGVEFSAG